MSHFPQNSLFSPTAAGETPVDDTELEVEPAYKDQRYLEDWAHRLQSAAYEAGDHGLATLESDLLDLRDDIVSELHTLIQS